MQGDALVSDVTEADVFTVFIILGLAVSAMLVFAIVHAWLRARPARRARRRARQRERADRRVAG